MHFLLILPIPCVWAAYRVPSLIVQDFSYTQALPLEVFQFQHRLELPLTQGPGVWVGVWEGVYVWVEGCAGYRLQHWW